MRKSRLSYASAYALGNWSGSLAALVVRPAMIAVVLLACLLVGLPAPLPAPVFGDCDGRDSALHQSDTVAIIRILESPVVRWQREHPTEPSPLARFQDIHMWGGYLDFRVYVVKTLVGDLPDHREHMIAMRFVKFTTVSPSEAERLYWGSSDDKLTTSVLHLAFLHNPWFGPRYESMWEPISASSINCKCSTLPLHPDTNLDLISRDNVREGIPALFRDSLSHYLGTPGEAGARACVDWCYGIPPPSPTPHTGPFVYRPVPMGTPPPTITGVAHTPAPFFPLARVPIPAPLSPSGCNPRRTRCP